MFVSVCEVSLNLKITEISLIGRTIKRYLLTSSANDRCKTNDCTPIYWPSSNAWPYTFVGLGVDLWVDFLLLTNVICSMIYRKIQYTKVKYQPIIKIFTYMTSHTLTHNSFGSRKFFVKVCNQHVWFRDNMFTTCYTLERIRPWKLP